MCFVRSLVLLGALLAALSGCVAYPAYPAYYSAPYPAYYGPPIYIGGGWGWGWRGGGHWH